LKQTNTNKMKYLVISLVIATFLFSCQDDDQVGATSPEETLELFPLALGNYWIYQVVKLDDLGNEEILPANDTVRIVGTTLINDEVYFRLEVSNFFGFEPSPTTVHVRDSSGFLVNDAGATLLSTTDFDEVVFSTETGPARFEYTMESTPETVSVPLGDFECLNYSGIVTDIYDENTLPREQFRFYSDGVGLVSSNIFFFSSNNFTWERRLIDFNLN